MKARSIDKRKAVSTTILTALVVCSFVGVVIAALVYVNVFLPNQAQQCGGGQSKDVCLTSIQLYSGTSSIQSLTQNCTGDAQIVLHGQILGNKTHYISTLEIYGGSLSTNETVLVSVSPRGCLNLATANPPLMPGFFSFYGWFSQPLAPQGEYSYVLAFDDGANQSGSLIAQIV